MRSTTALGATSSTNGSDSYNMSNTTPLWTSAWEDVVWVHQTIWFITLTVSIHVALIAIGLFGNGLVIFVILKTKRLHTVVGMFLGNLAVSDILITVLCMPVMLHYGLTESWSFGKVMCHAVFGAQGISMYVSAFTLAAIAVDRYRVIVYPFKNRLRVRHCYVIIALIWATACFISLPLFIFRKFEEINFPYYNIHVISCHEQYLAIPVSPSDVAMFKTLYTLLVFAATFLVPLIITSVAYIKIWLVLSHADTALSSNTIDNPAEAHKAVQNKRKAVKMLALVVVCFAVLWLPNHLFYILSDLAPELVFSASAYDKVASMSCNMVAWSSACCNPFLYGWLNARFRREFKSVFRCFGLGGTSRSFTNPKTKITEICNPTERSSVSVVVAPNRSRRHSSNL